MHSFNVHLQFLRLTEFSATEITEWSCSLWIRSTAISTMHFQVIQTQKELKISTFYSRTLAPAECGFGQPAGRARRAGCLSLDFCRRAQLNKRGEKEKNASHLFTKLALVRSFSPVLLGRVLHNIFLAQHGEPTHFAVVFSDGETEVGIVEYGAVNAIVK